MTTLVTLKELKTNNNLVKSISLSDLLQLQYRVQQNNEYSPEKTINFIVANELSRYGFYHKEILYALFNSEDVDIDRKFYSIDKTRFECVNLVEFISNVREIINTSEISFDELFSRFSNYISVNRSRCRFERRVHFVVTVDYVDDDYITCSYGNIRMFRVWGSSKIKPRKDEKIIVERRGYSLYYNEIKDETQPSNQQLKDLVFKFKN